jgi:hypothetical protein
MDYSKRRGCVNADPAGLGEFSRVLEVDLLFTLPAFASMALFTGDGAGGFAEDGATPWSVATTTALYPLAAGDWNGDGAVLE